MPLSFTDFQYILSVIIEIVIILYVVYRLLNFLPSLFISVMKKVTNKSIQNDTNYLMSWLDKTVLDRRGLERKTMNEKENES